MYVMLMSYVPITSLVAITQVYLCVACGDQVLSDRHRHIDVPAAFSLSAFHVNRITIVDRNRCNIMSCRFLKPCEWGIAAMRGEVRMARRYNKTASFGLSIDRGNAAKCYPHVVAATPTAARPLSAFQAGQESESPRC